MATETIVRTIDIRTEGSEKALGAVDKATGNVAKSTQQLESNLGGLPGPLSKVKSGVGQVSKAFKALLANPIVALIAAIVLAIVGLVKAFTKTQEGADKMKDAMAGLSAVVDVVIGRLAKIFKALMNIIKGNFKEGFQQMGDAVKGVGDEIREATKAAIAFEQATRDLFVAETDVITANAERRQQIEELVSLTRDFTQSIETRRQAIIRADAIEKQILQDNIALQQQRVDLAQMEIDNTPENLRTREQLRALAEAEGALIDMQTASLAKQRELKNRLNELDAKAAADRKAIRDTEAAEAAEEEALRIETEKLASDERKAEKELELLLEEEFNKSMLEMDKAFAKEQEEIDKENNAAMLASAEKRFKAEEDLIKQQIQNEQLLANVKEGIYQNSLTALLGFLGEGSRIAKAVQVADATRTAIITAMQAYKSAVGIPIVGAVLGPIAAAAALAVGMANVRKIIQTPDPTGAAQPASPNVSLAQPTQTIDLTQAEQGVPQDVQIIQDRTTRGGPQKAYVVSSDVTAEQEIDQKRKEDVTI